LITPIDAPRAKRAFELRHERDTTSALTLNATVDEQLNEELDDPSFESIFVQEIRSSCHYCKSRSGDKNLYSPIKNHEWKRQSWQRPRSWQR
jgi:hypothetical protein